MEQRTGRVDRIDSLLQRQSRWQGARTRPWRRRSKSTTLTWKTPWSGCRSGGFFDGWIGFIRLVHEPIKRRTHERRIDKNREILASTELPPPVEGRLKSAFPVRDEWLEGAARDHFRQVDVEALASLLEGTAGSAWSRNSGSNAQGSRGRSAATAWCG